jgi:hypothetical protein
MDTQEPREMVVVDIRMPFWSMVAFMVKWAIAAIPAITILLVFVVLLSALLRAMAVGLA